MPRLCVPDTNAVISFFWDVFQHSPRHGAAGSLSVSAREAMHDAIITQSGRALLSVPSIVLIEIYEKWLLEQEFVRRFYFEVFVPLRDSPYVEVRSLDEEVLDELIFIGGLLADHDLHDKIVVASAKVLRCALITTDKKIREFVESVPGMCFV